MHGMAFNADMVVLIKFLDMGTRAAAQGRCAEELEEKREGDKGMRRR